MVYLFSLWRGICKTDNLKCWIPNWQMSVQSLFKDTRTRSIPSRHLLVQNEQWNYQNNVWNLFWCFNCWLWRTKYRSSHWGCPKVKKVFLKISQNSQENSWATVSFLIKLQAWVQARSIVLVSVMLSLNMNLDAG